jgi:tungstate transport system ATP-binding protein
MPWHAPAQPAPQAFDAANPRDADMSAVRPILAVDGLRVRRGDAVTLDVPRLEVVEGELLALLGPNGAGKSTLLRCLALLERPDAGTVTFRGRALAWKEAVAYRRRTAMLLQEPALLDTSVFENVAVGLRLRGVSGKEIRPRVERWLDHLGIAHLARRAARTLSGGEARRVSLARALVLEPEVLFLDEPAITAVLVTHDQTEARALADRVAIMIRGSVREVGYVADVLDAPSDPEVAAFLQLAQLPGRRRRERGCCLDRL